MLRTSRIKLLALGGIVLVALTLRGQYSPPATATTASSGLARIGPSVTLAAPAASITFSAIPGTYKDLVIVFMGRMDNGTDEDVYMTANGDSGANYCQQYFGASNTTPAQANGCSSNATPVVVTIPGSGALANMPGVAEIRVIAYANTTFNKMAMSSNFWRGTTTSEFFLGWQWNNTSAITSLTLTPVTGGRSFITGTTATLYGRF